MDLVEIKDFPNYSFDKNTNQVYSHNYNKYMKPYIVKGYSVIGLINSNIDITNLQIDHIDMNRLNNNIENLRHCNRSENVCNRKAQKNNLSTGIKNIHKTRCNTYQVIIKKNRKQYNNSFKTLEEAIEYKKIKLIELHREFHNLG